MKKKIVYLSYNYYFYFYPLKKQINLIKLNTKCNYKKIFLLKII